VISVLVAAASLVVRAGLKSLVQQTPDCRVAGFAGSKELVDRAVELHPDVILWQISPDEDAAPVLHALPHQAVVLLTPNSAAELIRAGACGVLTPGVSEVQIGIALQAAAADLVVLSPESTTSPAASQAASGLTARETQVLRMIAEGLANKEIAYRLGISEHTVKFHVSALLGKLGAASRAEAVGSGIRQGIIMV
jgi:DNA-binding NarL/FixJ family response regulator